MKFSALTQKIKNFFQNPYLAPLTTPLKVIAAAAYAPISSFTDGIGAAVKQGPSAGPLLLRIYDKWIEEDRLAGATAGAGGIVVGVIGGIASGVMLGGAGVGALGIGFGGIAAAALIFVATPWVAIAALATIGAAAGAGVSPVAGVCGIVKAAKYAMQQKTQKTVLAAVPELKTQNDAAQERAAEIYQSLRALPADLRGPVVKMLNQKFASAGEGPEGAILKAIAVLPEKQRQSFVQSLRADMAADFAEAAAADAKEATALKQRLKPLETIRFAPKPKTGAA